MSPRMKASVASSVRRRSSATPSTGVPVAQPPPSPIRSRAFEQLRANGRLGGGDAQREGPLVREREQATDPTRDGVLGHGRVGERAELLQRRLRMLEPQGSGGEQMLG